MHAHLVEWSNLLIRTLHLIAGIAWIGNSFYFVWLDNALAQPETPKKGVEGDLWMVHSGGFYQVEKRKIGPGEMPKVLHWFKWEATFTWLTGFILLILVYHLHPETYLTPSAAFKLSLGWASAFLIAMPFISWVAYDSLWQVLDKKEKLGTLISASLLVAIIYSFCRFFGGRAAYIHVAAIMGTIMVLNVWVRILPAQQKMIDATREGRTPDFELGKKAKRRSMHNSYMTIPLLIIMLSNHYPGTYGNPLNWLILLSLFVAGACFRHVMIRGLKEGAWAFGLCILGFLGAVFLSWQPASVASMAGAGSEPPVSFQEARAIVVSRCVVCHAAKPADMTFGPMPAGLSFEKPEKMHDIAQLILFRVVTTQTMPPGNKTGVTPEERATLGRWINQGALLP